MPNHEMNAQESYVKHSMHKPTPAKRNQMPKTAKMKEKMSQYTPGPWRVADDEGGMIGDFHIESSEGVYVAACGSESGRSEAEANAKLIALCPAMYEFIKKRATMGDESAKSLIASAEGRTA